MPPVQPALTPTVGRAASEVTFYALRVFSNAKRIGNSQRSYEGRKMEFVDVLFFFQQNWFLYGEHQCRNDDVG